MSKPVVVVVESVQVQKESKMKAITKAGGLAVFVLIKTGSAADIIGDDALQFNVLITDHIGTIRDIRQQNKDVLIVGLSTGPQADAAFLEAGATMCSPPFLSVEAMKGILARLPAPAAV